MLGPLPTIYRVVVSVCALLAFIGLGVWVSLMLPESFVAPMGAGVGAGIGVVVVLLLLADLEHRRPSHRAAHRVRIRSHHHH
jgi:sterol desaturase/sphingolipid hydroxylase (fatty acid hydroxylase superfamily)